MNVNAFVDRGYSFNRELFTLMNLFNVFDKVFKLNSVIDQQASIR